MNKIRAALFSAAIGAASSAIGFAFADGFSDPEGVPRLLQYEGNLLQNGFPVPDGPQTLRFTLYGAASGGNPLWNASEFVTTLNGHFAVTLGNTAGGKPALPTDVFDAGDVWLEVAVLNPASQFEIVGRQRVVSVPYARRAASAASADAALVATSAVSATSATNAASAATASDASPGSALDERIAALESAVSGSGIVPVGTILAWHRDVRGTASPLSIPSGWVPCNGGTVQDPTSPIYGAAVPDLNSAVYSGGRGRYLRGGAQSGTTNESTRVSGNGAMYYLATTGTYRGYGTGAARWWSADSTSGDTGGSQLIYDSTYNDFASTPDNYPRVQVAAMTVIFIMRVR